MRIEREKGKKKQVEYSWCACVYKKRKALFSAFLFLIFYSLRSSCAEKLIKLESDILNFHGTMIQFGWIKQTKKKENLESERQDKRLMSFGRLKEIQRTIVQSSSSLRSNNNKIYNDEHLQSKEMPSKNKTKTNKEDLTFLIRLKVRFYLFIFFLQMQLIEEKGHYYYYLFFYFFIFSFFLIWLKIYFVNKMILNV